MGDPNSPHDFDPNSPNAGFQIFHTEKFSPAKHTSEVLLFLVSIPNQLLKYLTIGSKLLGKETRIRNFVFTKNRSRKVKKYIFTARRCKRH